jgi:prepilin-type N-terminal cleavage/methylation domain-containing protein
LLQILFTLEEHMSCGSSFWPNPQRERSRWTGFTLIEVLITMAIAIVLTAISVPLVRNAYTSYRLAAAVSSVSGAIQTTRYQAISAGYPFQVVFSKANSTYQVQSDPTRTGTFANVANAVPFGTQQMALGANTTIQCHPSGLLTASVGSSTLTLTYSNKQETIMVSSYGNIKVTP